MWGAHSAISSFPTHRRALATSVDASTITLLAVWAPTTSRRPTMLVNLSSDTKTTARIDGTTETATTINFLRAATAAGDTDL